MVVEKLILNHILMKNETVFVSVIGVEEKVEWLQHKKKKKKFKSGLKITERFNLIKDKFYFLLSSCEAMKRKISHTRS